MSEFGGGAENICSHGVFRILTRNGSKKARSQKRELMFSNGQR
jgi:hypothetical protein